MDQALFNQYYGQLGATYDPQTKTINSRRAGIATDSKAALSGLEQAKINAFKDIEVQSNTRGGYFSGFRPDAQATYTGEKYLPAVANVQRSQRDALTALQEALNQTTASRNKDAMGLYQNEIQRRQAQAQWEQEQAAKERQFQMQMQSDAANRAASAASSAVVDPYKGFNASVNKVDGQATGTSFFGPGNQPITAGQYYAATGTGLQGVANFLSNDQDPTSKKAYNDLSSGKYTPDALTKKYPWIFGGV